jgi:hypothetical protein
MAGHDEMARSMVRILPVHCIFQPDSWTAAFIQQTHVSYEPVVASGVKRLQTPGAVEFLRIAGTRFGRCSLAPSCSSMFARESLLGRGGNNPRGVHCAA